MPGPSHSSAATAVPAGFYIYQEGTSATGEGNPARAAVSLAWPLHIRWLFACLAAALFLFFFLGISISPRKNKNNLQQHLLKMCSIFIPGNPAEHPQSKAAPHVQTQPLASV